MEYFYLFWFALAWFQSTLAQITSFLKKDFIYLFLGSRREGKREGNINVWLPLECSLLGTWPAIQACVLTGNWTSNLLPLRSVFNPLSHTSQRFLFLSNNLFKNFINLYLSFNNLKNCSLLLTNLFCILETLKKLDNYWFSLP